MLDKAHPHSAVTMMQLVTDLLCAELRCIAITEKVSS